MPSRKTRTAKPSPNDESAIVAATAAATVGGPSLTAGPGRGAAQKAAVQALAQERAFNRNKASEYGADRATDPPEGEHAGSHPDDAAGASTLAEDTPSDKLGSGAPPIGRNANDGTLDRVRVDSTGQAITTNHGVPVADNQHSLKAGLRGPTLLEDFILREKITHFDHERIPERVVHARGSGAHGTFECTEALGDLTRADLFSQKGKRTPVFVRFSTVAGERGSADAVRDTRGFAVKFYTQEGNWDLVGNNIPVFFIQDAMKFPDVVHAVKPEPHHGMPQASSAHDTFWDFISLMPESIHHTLWVMSDRGIPRSYRTMQGFGVHTWRLVNAQGQSRFVKFHWLPVAGTHSLVWDEAVRVNGADPDFHRRDLWEAIEGGHFPQWDLALQVFTEEEAERFSFDVLDATKIVPEELVPLRTVGRLTLDRNPDNFFAETEQVAFCVAHLVPGIDFSNDPLLAGRIHSYLDTQITRLGGANFHEIPINSPIAPLHNNQRDGAHRQAIARGRVAYEPNSLGGGCPHQAGGARGFVSFAEPVEGPKLRAKPEKFADHFSQARLFFRSQTPFEQRHIVEALRFELARVTVPAIRERMVALLRNVDEALANELAEGLGLVLPEAQPTALPFEERGEVDVSPALSLLARPGDGSIAGRRVALLAAHGAQTDSLRQVQRALARAGAVPRIVASRLGEVQAEAGEALPVDASCESLPSALWDAAVLPAGDAALQAMAVDAQMLDFVREQYRHGKPLLALGDTTLLEAAGIAFEGDLPGVVCCQGDEGEAADALDARIENFVAAIGRHRFPEREELPRGRPAAMPA